MTKPLSCTSVVPRRAGSLSATLEDLQAAVDLATDIVGQVEESLASGSSDPAVETLRARWHEALRRSIWLRPSREVIS